MCNVLLILPIVSYTVITITTMIPITMMITIMAHLTHLVIQLAKRK